MHPAIRDGWFVVVDPNGLCTPGEYVVVTLDDGQRLLKELVIERPAEIVVAWLAGAGRRMTIPRSEIQSMHLIAAVVAPSAWRRGEEAGGRHG